MSFDQWWSKQFLFLISLFLITVESVLESNRNKKILKKEKERARERMRELEKVREIRNELEKKKKEGQIEMGVGQVCGGEKTKRKKKQEKKKKGKRMDAIKFGKII